MSGLESLVIQVDKQAIIVAGTKEIPNDIFIVESHQTKMPSFAVPTMQYQMM